MKVIRIMLLALLVSVVGCLVSCKEETPADKIDATTTKLVDQAEDLKKEIDKKAEEANK